MWKSRGGIVVNGVPREVPRPKPEGPQAPRVFGRGTSRGTAFTTIHPRLFHTFSFFRHPGPVRRDFLYCRQTQPAPREYHTQCYIVEVQTLVELNPNILVQLSKECTMYTTYCICTCIYTTRCTFLSSHCKYPEWQTQFT